MLDVDFLLCQVLAPSTPPVPTQHATVIVPAPVQTQPHHVTVVTMGPTSVINSVSTSRQNLDTIVQVGPYSSFQRANTRGCCCHWHTCDPPGPPQAIQHIEGTQGKSCEEEQRRAVIVTPGRVLSDAAGSDTASNSDGPDDCSLPWGHPRRLALPHTYIHAHTKSEADYSYGMLRERTLTGLVVRLKHSILVFFFSLFQ